MRFVKYQALGNDFIIFNWTSESLNVPGIDVKSVCHRRTGVGADGVLYLLPSETADIRMRIFNADGSEAEMCGNGVRALVFHALHERVVEGDVVKVETLAGIRSVRVLDIGKSSAKMQVSMGTPSFLTRDVPMAGIEEEEAVGIEILCGETRYEAICLSLGNPHCVCFTEELESVDLEHEGSCLESHPCFPQRTNVEFAQVEARDRLRARIWERGVGVTPSCGTGACACVAAGSRTGRCSNSAVVELPGGNLAIDIRDGGEIQLAGEVRRVFEGSLR